MSGRLKETSITCPTIETEDHAITLVAESEIETTPWTGETGTTQEKTQAADRETIHEKPETYKCFRTIDKTIAMIHARDLDNDTILENVGRNNKIDRFDLSHLAMTGDKTVKT